MKTKFMATLLVLCLNGLHYIQAQELTLSVSPVKVTDFNQQGRLAFANGAGLTASYQTSRKTSLGLSGKNEGAYGAGPGAALQSLIVPGWGLYNTSGKIYYLVLAPVTYITVGYGINAKFKSKKVYDQYLASRDKDEIQELYDEANGLQKQFVGTTTTGIFIWLAQAGVTLVHGMYNDAYRQREELWNGGAAMRFAPAFDPNTSSFGMRASISF